MQNDAPEVGEIRLRQIHVPLRSRGFDETTAIDVDNVFWVEHLRIDTVPHRWNGTAWEVIAA